ncbi:M48 family metalloprotease [Streptosporangium sp. 'caverna']|uniref:M48 family metalloprotease n=1 Tax=Streptosporangium sp. 'caverna' TaxID=2202249 RepID=UPI000D7E54D4|nr:M48 family metalloprotease [Streptosporangium sp. 'caverna']AWS44630.1 hypothetical protein DKM19_28135 [Streptosporangium sp. 'caverna']
MATIGGPPRGEPAPANEHGRLATWTPPVATPPRLDPFALPAATTARFLLMIVVAVTSSIHLYVALLGWFVSVTNRVNAAPYGCALTTRATAGRIPDRDLVAAYIGCVRGVTARNGFVLIGMVLVLVAAAVAIYLVHPRLVMLSRPRPLAQLAVDEGMAAVVRRVEETVRAVAPKAEVYVATLRATASGRTFGRSPRYRIILDLGLLREADTDPGRLDVVLAHELAHLRNRDAGLTTFAFAIWWAYVLVVALPTLVVSIIEPVLFASLSWRLAAMLVLLWLARTSVLRTREYYADLRSGSTPESERLLLSALRPRRPDAGKRRWGLLSYHPGDDERMSVLGGAPRLFRIGVAEPAAAGMLVGLGYSPCVHLVAMIWGTGSTSFNAHRLVVGLVFGALATGAVAGTAWRAGLLARATRTRPPSTLLAALALTAGVLGGQLVAPPLGTSGSWSAILGANPAVAVALAVLLAVLFQLMLRWALLCATVWLPLARRVRSAALIGSIQSALIFGSWLSFWFGVIELMTDGAPTWNLLWVSLFSTTLNPALQLCVLLACAFPLAGWAARRGLPPRPPAAIWRDAPPSRLAAPRVPLPAVNITALTIVLVYAAGMIPFYARLHAVLGRVPFGGTVTPAVMIGVFMPVLVAGLAVAVLGAFCFGLVAGGRGNTSSAVAGAGLLMLLAVFGIVPLAFAHLSAAACGAEGMWSCLAPLPDHLDLSRSGPIFTIGFAVLILAGTAAAWAGSALRSGTQALSTGPTGSLSPWGSDPPDGITRRPVSALLALVPTALAVTLFGYLAIAAVAGTQGERVAVDRAVVTRELDAVPKGPLLPVQACVAAGSVTAEVALSDAFGPGMVIGVARGAGYAMATRDPIAQAMGREGAAALLAGDYARAVDANSALRNICMAFGVVPVR